MTSNTNKKRWKGRTEEEIRSLVIKGWLEGQDLKRLAKRWDISQTQIRDWIDAASVEDGWSTIRPYLLLAAYGSARTFHALSESEGSTPSEKKLLAAGAKYARENVVLTLSACRDLDAKAAIETLPEPLNSPFIIDDSPEGSFPYSREGSDAEDEEDEGGVR